MTDHREDSTFSFDPSKINIKTLTKDKQKRIDARKGVLLSSYTRKKTRRRKRGRSSAGQEKNGGARSRFLYLYLRSTFFCSLICHVYRYEIFATSYTITGHMNKVEFLIVFNQENALENMTRHIFHAYLCLKLQYLFFSLYF